MDKDLRKLLLLLIPILLATLFFFINEQSFQERNNIEEGKISNSGRYCYKISMNSFEGKSIKTRRGCYSSGYSAIVLQNNLTILSWRSFNKLHRNLEEREFEKISGLGCLECLNIVGENKDLTINLSILRDLKNLQILRLKDIGARNFGELKQINELHFTHHELKNISPICKLRNLEILNIQNTNLYNISCIKRLENLKFLIIKDNPNLSDIAPLENMSNLKLVDIRKTATSLEDVKKLRESLNNTKILAFNERKNPKNSTKRYQIRSKKIKERLRSFGYLR